MANFIDLRVSRLRLKNVRGFQSLDLKLGSSGSSLLLTGDNGEGKSTVLRALALGLSDELGASGLLSELPGEFIRYGSKHDAQIRVELASKSSKIDYRIDTFVKRRNRDVEYIRQRFWKRTDSKLEKNWAKVRPRSFPWSRIFGVGYGAGLRLLGTERFQHYYLTDAVYSLFKMDAKLQEQELVVRRLLSLADEKLRSEKDVHNEIVGCLRSVLNLGNDVQIELRQNGIFFDETELTAMGDGVRAIVTLVLDLLSWWYLYLFDYRDNHLGDSYRANSVPAIAIIDEIEKHLHPAWQRNIVSNLLNTFPKVQFIVSTHSPLCVSGATEFPKSKIGLYRTKRSQSGSLIGEAYQLPKGFRADQVLTSKAFGLLSTASPRVEELTNVVREELRKKAIGDWNEERYEEAKKELDSLSPLLAEREEDRQREEEILHLLEEIEGKQNDKA